MVLRSILTLFLILCVFESKAKPARSQHGQKDFSHYYGPHDPMLEFNLYLNQAKFIDDEINRNYVSYYTDDQVNVLSDFFNFDLYSGMNCPDSAYVKKYDYMRFLSRLQALSYLFQSLREHEYHSKRLGAKNSCMVNWKKLIQSCTAETNEMKLFLDQSKIAFNSLAPVIVSFADSKLEKRESWLHALRRGDNNSLTQVRLREYCSENNCLSFKKESVSSSLNSICDEEVDSFKRICSEKDFLYGNSNAVENYLLISQSSGVRGIDQDGLAKGCLKRFIEQNKTHEKQEKPLKSIFSLLYNHNIRSSSSNPQGRLYAIGALKEFTDKGLTAIFKKKVVTEKKPVLPQEEKVVLSNPEFENIILPKWVKKKVIKKTPKKAIKKIMPIEEVKKSSFLVKSEFRREYEMEKVMVDMKKFKYDYIFTLEKTETLAAIVRKYSSVKSLRYMKKRDKLGSEKAPLPLKFIKFLVDKEMNQNIYNIILTLGEKFYIFNDIDKSFKNLKLELIELKNDASTDFKWQMFIHRS